MPLNSFDFLAICLNMYFLLFIQLFHLIHTQTNVSLITDCSPELYDVVIVSEDGTELKCHKCILVARLGMCIYSTYFNFDLLAELQRSR